MAALQPLDDAADRVVGLGVDDRPPADADGVGAAVATGRRGRRARGRRGRKGPAFWLAVGWLVVVAFCGIAATWLPLQDPTTPNVVARLDGPNADNLLGADALGRDQL